MKRLYWTNPDVFETQVDVTAVADCKVTITPVLFHPDEGGQPADRGTISGATVRSVEVIDGQIVHTLDKPLVDGQYLAHLDKSHRLYTAGQHTAQHILSGIAQKQFGLATVGVHIGLERSTVDFDKAVDWDTAAELERQSIEVVTLDIPVETVFNDPDVRMRNGCSPIEADVVRVVKIGEYDKSACCGAHLGTTGQIGVIRILGIESKKNGTRVTFVAGMKALEYSQVETAVLRELRKLAGLIAEAISGAGVAVSGLNIAVSSAGISAKDILARIQSVAGGKGGGSPRAASGKLGRAVTPDEIVAILSSNGKEK